MIALLVAAAVSGGQFDLNCNVRFQVFSDGTLVIDKQEMQRYRVDLDTKRVCSDDCYNSFPIRSVTDKIITFVHSKNGDHVWVDRMTGEISGYLPTLPDKNIRVPMLSQWRGTCEKMPFTPFRKPKF